MGMVSGGLAVSSELVLVSQDVLELALGVLTPASGDTLQEHLSGRRHKGDAPMLPHRCFSLLCSTMKHADHGVSPLF